MSLYKQKLNTRTGQFNLVPSNAVLSFKDSVDTAASLPMVGNLENDARITNDTQMLYVWNGTSWSLQGDIMDVNWSAISGKPNSSVSDIDDAVNKKHIQGTDQGLDTGGVNAVTAAQAKSAYTHSGVITGNPHQVNKSDVGLGNVDNVSEATIITDVKLDSAIADSLSKRHSQNTDIALRTDKLTVDVSGNTDIKGNFNLPTAGIIKFNNLDYIKVNHALSGIFLGYLAGQTNTGQFATIVGYQAGNSNTGSYTTLIGYQAGKVNQGNNNTFIGNNAGLETVGGNYNTAIGATAMHHNITGQYNVVLGLDALKTPTGANNNIAIGFEAGKTAKTALLACVLIGHQAGATSTGDICIFVGNNAGNANTKDYVTAIGNQAGVSNSGVMLCALGNYAGSSNSGDNVVGMGYYASRLNVGHNLVAIGYFSGEENSGDNVTALGYESGYFNSGANVIAIGFQAGKSNTNTYSVFVGYQAGLNNMGVQTVAIGRNAADANSGDYCNAIGFQAGKSNTGDFLVSIGHNAGNGNTGANCVFLGREAGKENSIDNQFIVKQVSANATPLIQGDFSTGTVDVAGEMKIKVYSQDTEPTLSATNRFAYWIDTNDNYRTYLIFRRNIVASGLTEQVKVELI